MFDFEKAGKQELKALAQGLHVLRLGRSIVLHCSAAAANFKHTSHCLTHLKAIPLVGVGVVAVEHLHVGDCRGR